MLVDVRDESTDDVRIVLEIKKGADPALVMAYLYKHTPLADELPRQPDLPRARPRTARSRRPSGSISQAMLRALPRLPRATVVARRFEFELAELERAHPHPRGLRARSSTRSTRSSGSSASRDGKADAAAEAHEALRARRGADRRDPRAQALQARAARDPRHPRGARARSAPRPRSIEAILGERAQAAGRVVRGELGEVARALRRQAAHQDRRRGGDEPEFDAEAFIVDEDANVVLTRDGWVKRVRELKDLSATRLREGDAVLAVVPRLDARSRSPSSRTSAAATSCRINDVPASTGYGDPVQKLFKFDDGERVVGALLARSRAQRRAPRATLRRWPSRKRGFGLRFAPRRRTASCRRAPAAASRKLGRGRRDRRRRARAGDEDIVVRRDRATRTCCCCKRRRDRRARQPGPRRHRHQGRRRRRVIGFGVGARRTRTCIVVETDKRQGDPDRARALQQSRRAAARATALKRKTTIVARRARPCPRRRRRRCLNVSELT